MIHVYAIVGDSSGVRAVTRECDAAPEATPGAVWDHERVVEELMERHAVLPARFGTTFADRAELDACLERHRDELIEGLERVRNCVELGVRVMAEEANAVKVEAHASGRGCQVALAAAETRVGELHEQVNVPLAELAREAVVRPVRGREVVMSGAYLVERDRGQGFRDRVRELSD